MAIYTWDDFQKAAAKQGWSEGNGFSTADWNLAKENPAAGMSILNSKLDYIKAGTSEERAAANKRAEEIRSAYGGYTGGKNGAGFYLNQPSPQQFNYSPAPTFSYDPDSDVVTQAYMKRYAREGNRATQNALGSAAAMTGGIPSSYAVAAASQAGDYYASQAADKIPELYQQAYNRYVNDLNQWNTDRNFAYGQYLDEINAQTQNRQEELQRAQLGYQVGDNRGLEALGYDLSNDPAAWERRQAEQQYAAQLGISLGDYSKAKEYYGIEADQQMLNADMLYNLAVLRYNQGDPTLLNQLIEKYYPGMGGQIPTYSDEGAYYGGGSGGGYSGGYAAAVESPAASLSETKALTPLTNAQIQRARAKTDDLLGIGTIQPTVSAANSSNTGSKTSGAEVFRSAVDRLKKLYEEAQAKK